MGRTWISMLAAVVLLAGCGSGAAPIQPAEADARLLADAIERIVTEDAENARVGGAFERVAVVTSIAGDVERPLDQRTRDLVVAALDPVPVTFVDGTLETAPRPGTWRSAVVAVVEARLHGDAAELRLVLGCGEPCGVGVDYRASRDDGGRWRLGDGTVVGVA